MVATKQLVYVEELIKAQRENGMLFFSLFLIKNLAYETCHVPTPFSFQPYSWRSSYKCD